jgi:gamma-glutamyl-gamma-aminobutyrate hydrolase PuuD
MMQLDIRIPKIGIIQGSREYPERNEIRDELDQNWALLAEQISVCLVPIPNRLNDPIRWFDTSGIEGIILSGGGDFFEASNNLEYYEGIVLEDLSAPELRCRAEAYALQFAAKRGLKILGVCRGMQLINSLHGGQIQEIDNHISVTHEVNLTEFGQTLSAFPPKFVNSFHGYGIPQVNLGEKLIPLALSGMCVEMFSDELLQILGLMWHPERSKITDANTRILKDFFHSKLLFIDR